MLLRQTKLPIRSKDLTFIFPIKAKIIKNSPLTRKKQKHLIQAGVTSKDSNETTGHQRQNQNDSFCRCCCINRKRGARTRWQCAGGRPERQVNVKWFTVTQIRFAGRRVALFKRQAAWMIYLDTRDLTGQKQKQKQANWQRRSGLPGSRDGKNYHLYQNGVNYQLVPRCEISKWEIMAIISKNGSLKPVLVQTLHDWNSPIINKVAAVHLDRHTWQVLEYMNIDSLKENVQPSCTAAVRTRWYNTTDSSTTAHHTPPPPNDPLKSQTKDI